MSSARGASGSPTSIAITGTTTFAGVKLRAPAPFSVSQFNRLRLSVFTTTPNPDLQIALVDVKDAYTRAPVRLSAYGGVPAVNTWTTYEIALEALNGVNQVLTAVAIQYLNGQGGRTVWIDDVEFVSAPGVGSTVILTPTVAITRNIFPAASNEPNYWATTNASYNNNVTTAPQFNGMKAFRVTLSGAQGSLYFCWPNDIQISQFHALTFVARTANPNANWFVTAHNPSDAPFQTVWLNNYGGPPTSNWKRYVIPLADFKPTHPMFHGLTFAGSSWSGTASLEVTDLRVVGYQLPASGGGAGDVLVFNDFLAAEWENWSWGSVLDFANPAPVRRGSVSLAWQAQPGASSSGLALHSQVAVNTAGLTHLTFFARASASGGSYVVALYNPNWQLIQSPVSLSAYGGAPSTTDWTSYAIPLSVLNPSNVTVRGLLIQRASVTTETLYLDSIGFTAGTTPLAIEERDPSTIDPAVAALLDTTAPTGTVALQHIPSDGHSRVRMALLLLDATDTESGMGWVRVSVSPDFANAPWQRFSPLQLVALDDTHRVWVQFRDNAGNESAPLEARATFQVFSPSIGRNTPIAQ
ncbi:MAG: hypothetical protein NZ518_01230 [Dehalococcoidia bacterium]|nr:hypothetical protein [Dehalococcoidia bacterium]